MTTYLNHTVINPNSSQPSGRRVKASWLATLALVLVFMSPASHSADALLVVANLGDSQSGENKVNLTREQVRNLFMGIPVGKGLSPVALSPDNHLRTGFNTRIIGMAESRIQSYWAQMKFTGRKSPPPEFKSEEQLLEFLQNNPGSVGYVSEDTALPSGLQVVYEDAL